MYLSHYRLEAKPFQICPDPRFLWLGEKHLKALGTLQTAMENGGGMLLLTGGVGTGKTTLVNALVNSLEERFVIARVQDPSLEMLDFFNFVAHGFGLEVSFANKGAFLAQFTQFLRNTAAAGRKAMLIIDEAQRLNQTLLDELYLLLKTETPGSPAPLTLFLVGQEEFLQTIESPGNGFLRQRIATHHHLQPLSEKETGTYVQHRLRVAGARKQIFRPDAIPEIFDFSHGHPRLINIIADLALLTGYVKEKHSLSAGLVQTAAAKLRKPFEPEALEPDGGEEAGCAQAAQARTAEGTAGSGAAPPSRPSAPCPAPSTIELSVPLPNAFEGANVEDVKSVIADLLKEYAEELVEAYAGELIQAYEAERSVSRDPSEDDGGPDLDRVRMQFRGRRVGQRQTAFYLEEKRRHKRMPLFLAIDYKVGDRVIRDFIDDLSIGGVFIETRQRFSVGQEVTMTFTLPRSKRHYKVGGKVIRVERMGIAVRFRETIDYT